MLTVRHRSHRRREGCVFDGRDIKSRDASQAKHCCSPSKGNPKEEGSGTQRELIEDQLPTWGKLGNRKSNR